MIVKVAINGFGRIGRLVLRAGINDPDIEFLAINDLTDPHTLKHLLKYDSVHGRFQGEITNDDSSITINGKSIPVFSEADPKKLPWQKLNIDVVAECTGRFREKQKAYAHIEAGAKKVLVSAPMKDAEFTIVKGVNEHLYNKAVHNIVSNASCTTNCVAPVIKVLHDNFGIERGFLTTVHADTNDQHLVDVPHKDLRRARAAGSSIIPTSTGAAKAVALVIPELEGKLDGIAMRVPIIDGSVSDLVIELRKEASAAEINALFRNVATYHLNGILSFTDEPIVSVDIIHNPHSSIVDGLSTMVNGRLVKIIAWYDNEWGYSSRMIDVMKILV